MDEILDLAEQLGKRIAADPRGQRMIEAQQAVTGNDEARQLLIDYEAAQKKLHELELQQKPIEPEDKRGLADLHAKVVGNDVIKALSKAQVDFAELMSAVSRRIEQHVQSGAAGESAS